MIDPKFSSKERDLSNWKQILLVAKIGMGPGSIDDFRYNLEEIECEKSLLEQLSFLKLHSCEVATFCDDYEITFLGSGYRLKLFNDDFG